MGTITRQRTRVKDGTARRVSPPRERYDLVLPQSYVYRKLAERIHAAGLNVSTREGVTDRPVDAPVLGQTVVLPRDEREAKTGKALLYVDHRPGMTPLTVAGGGEMYWQDLKEIADEARHYGLDHDRDLPARRDIRDVWIEMAERRARARSGRKVYGALPRR